MTLNRLNDLYPLKKEIEDIDMQIKELTFISGSLTSAIPSGNNISSPVEKHVMKISSLIDSLTEKIALYIEEREEIERYINDIAEAEIRVIARMRFIDHRGYQEIGDVLHMERTTVAKKLKRYIKNEKRRSKESAD